MSKLDNNNPTPIQPITQFESKPLPILLSSDDDAADAAYDEDLSLTNANINVNPSSLSSSDAKKMTNEITPTQSHVKDPKKKAANGELKKTEVVLGIDPVAKSDNVVLQKLLHGPRYFDPPDNSWGNCYNCGEAGHTVSYCTAAKRKKPCFVCGSLEHNARQCKQVKDCFICKRGGHRAKNCPEKSMEGFQKAKLCLKCGDSGHEMFICKSLYSLDELKEVECYICKCFGHLCCFKYGKGRSEASCYRCGQLGHAGLECASASGRAHVHEETTSTASPSSCCYKCGEEGHKARKCTRSAKKRKRKTEFSHLKATHLKDNREHVGVGSAPPDDAGQGEARKRNKTQRGCSNSSQPKQRGGWINEDPGGGYCHGSFNNNKWGSPSTPPTYRSNNSFNGNHGASGYGSGLAFQYEASGSNGYRHRFSASRFDNSSNYGRRDYGWGY